MGAELLFEAFSQRYERGLTIVTSNLPFEDWTQVLGSERLTGALLDRLTHHVSNSFRAGRIADLAAHPTCKPVDLVADAIMDVSHRDDLVLDAFLGSSTTLLAAHRTGRRAAGIEIDPHYVDVALRRFGAASGMAMTREDGVSFAELDRLQAEAPAADDMAQIGTVRIFVCGRA